MSTMRLVVNKAFFTCLYLRDTKMVFFCIFLYFFSDVLTSENVALRKPAIQSSTSIVDSHATADKAVDGNTDGDFAHHTCTHSLVTDNNWWKVDLMGFYNVTSVHLFTRTDCCLERLTNFEVRVSESDPMTFPSGEGQQCIFYTQQVADTGTLLECTRPITGRFVSLYKAADSYLSICEIYVYGTKLDFGLYQLVQDNFRIDTFVMTSLTTASLSGCARQCLSDVTCLAFNVMASGTRADGGVTCELLSLTQWVTSMTLEAQTGWRAYKLLIN